MSTRGGEFTIVTGTFAIPRVPFQERHRHAAGRQPPGRIPRAPGLGDPGVLRAADVVRGPGIRTAIGRRLPARGGSATTVGVSDASTVKATTACPDGVGAPPEQATSTSANRSARNRDEPKGRM